MVCERSLVTHPVGCVTRLPVKTPMPTPTEQPVPSDALPVPSGSAVMDLASDSESPMPPVKRHRRNTFDDSDDDADEE